MADLEGVTQVTVDVFALGMAETDEQLYRKTTTLMTNDPVVAGAFRPYRFKRTHEREPPGGGRGTRGSQKHTEQFQLQ